MKILNPRNSERYTINGITLYASTYLRHEVKKRFVDSLKDEFSQTDIVYDIVMSITSEFGDDYNIEGFLLIFTVKETPSITEGVYAWVVEVGNE